MTADTPTPARLGPPRAEINAHTLRNAVVINDEVFYQPERGTPQLLASAEELGKVDRRAWIRRELGRLGAGSPFRSE